MAIKDQDEYFEFHESPKELFDDADHFRKAMGFVPSLPDPEEEAMDPMFKNADRLKKIREFAESIVSTVDLIAEAGDYCGDVNDLDDPFWGEIGSIGYDLDSIRDLIEEIE